MRVAVRPASELATPALPSEVRVLPLTYALGLALVPIDATHRLEETVARNLLCVRIARGSSGRTSDGSRAIRSARANRCGRVRNQPLKIQAINGV
jgi:hypothetical protein